MFMYCVMTAFGMVALYLIVKRAPRATPGGILLILGAGYAYACRRSHEDVGVLGVVVAGLGLILLLTTGTKRYAADSEEQGGEGDE